MNKFTTDQYDSQHCTVRLNSGSITVKNESHAVELRYLDETDLLKAVCQYIEARHWDRNAEAIQHELLRSMSTLGKKIDAAKAESAA